jgi:hypothetical protein
VNCGTVELQTSSTALALLGANYPVTEGCGGATTAGRWRVDVTSISPVVRNEYNQIVRFEKA